MSAATLASNRYVPPALGLGSFVVVIVLVELLIRIGLINRFIVPLPSEIVAAFPRVIVEEDVLQRFLLTAGEAFSASILVTLFGVAGGVLLYRYHLLRLATETWVAAVAAAPLVLMYPLWCTPPSVYVVSLANPFATVTLSLDSDPSRYGPTAMYHLLSSRAVPLNSSSNTSR